MKKRDHGLDGLRGIAAIAVALSHVAAITWTPFLDKVPAPDALRYLLWNLGAPAVDLFFVLSGFVVARSLIERKEGYVPFLMKRWTRLLPIAWLGVMAGLIARHFAETPPMGTSNLVHALSTPLTQTDILSFSTMIAPFPHSEYVNPALWSLFIEMQITFAMPLLAILARRSPLAIGATGFGAMLLATICTGTYYPILFFGFLVGAAYAGSVRRIPRPKIPALVMAIGMGVLMIRLWTGDEETYQRIIGSIGALGVIIAVRAGFAARILESAPVQWLGAISYPLYAIHFPILVLGVVLAGNAVGATWAAVAAIPFALAAATLARIAIDSPSIKLSRLVG